MILVIVYILSQSRILLRLIRINQKYKLGLSGQTLTFDHCNLRLLLSYQEVLARRTWAQLRDLIIVIASFDCCLYALYEKVSVYINIHSKFSLTFIRVIFSAKFTWVPVKVPNKRVLLQLSQNKSWVWALSYMTLCLLLIRNGLTCGLPPAQFLKGWTGWSCSSTLCSVLWNC